MKGAIRLLAVVISVSTASAIVMGAPASAAGDKTTTKAWFGDHWIDMAKGWESATACAVSASAAVCFATEREMDSYLAATAASVTAAPATAGVCSTSMRLYDGASYTGNLLYLSSQGTFLNLANYGFDNITTSYKIGACSSYFYSGASGGGSLYPIQNTEAFDQYPTMLSGWNNALSSVYMN